MKGMDHLAKELGPYPQGDGEHQKDVKTEALVFNVRADWKGARLEMVKRQL
jgi:hypothetical protein